MYEKGIKMVVKLGPWDRFTLIKADCKNYDGNEFYINGTAICLENQKWKQSIS